jgi:hypothetical protein
MSYPNAYCVKCGTHTATQQKHTVVLQNNARALKGVCPACSSDVFKILPKVKEGAAKMKLTDEERRRYPDAYCVKCQAHTPTVNAHTVMLENSSRAVTGSCRDCGSEVYRIVGNQGPTLAAPAAAAPAPLATMKAAEATAMPAPAAIAPIAMAPRTMATLMATGPKASRTVKDAGPRPMPQPMRRVAITRRAEDASLSHAWTAVVALGVIGCLVVGFLAVAMI